MTAERADVPAPARPPTTAGALAHLLPGPLRVAADLAVLLPLAAVAAATHFRGIRLDGPPWSASQVVAYRPWLPVTLAAAGVAGAYALVLWGRRGRGSARPHPAAVAALFVVGALALAGRCAYRAWEIPRTATLGPDVTAPEGTPYRTFRTHWPGVVEHALVRPVASWWTHETLEIVATTATPGDDDGFSVRLVRPRSAAGTHPVAGAPVVHEGWVLVFDDDGACVLAHRPARGTSLQRVALTTLSPFLLLGADEAGCEQDLLAVEEAVRAQRTHPADRTLARELDSGNAWVRTAARRLVRAGGPELYPEATKRL